MNAALLLFQILSRYKFICLLFPKLQGLASTIQERAQRTRPWEILKANNRGAACHACRCTNARWAQQFAIYCKETDIWKHTSSRGTETRSNETEYKPTEIAAPAIKLCSTRLLSLLGTKAILSVFVRSKTRYDIWKQVGDKEKINWCFINFTWIKHDLI